MDNLKIAFTIKEVENTDPAYAPLAYVPQFLSTGAILKDGPKIPMNRKDDGCFTAIDRLQDHNHHTPPFKTKEEAEAYIQRVMNAANEAAKDIPEAVEGKGIEPPVDMKALSEALYPDEAEAAIGESHDSQDADEGQAAHDEKDGAEDDDAPMSN